MTTTFYPSLNSLGVIPVSRLKNLEKNEGLGKFKDSAICQTGRSLYFSCSDTRGLPPVRLIQSLLLRKCSGEAFFARRLNRSRDGSLICFKDKTRKRKSL
jgi:hypothetical protein